MKKIGIYPGNFQPATKAHLEVYKRLKSMVGTDSFIATTDREPQHLMHHLILVIKNKFG